MKTVTSVKALREVLSAVDSTGIGLVPTMGALHAGHRSLVERARCENATVVVSVFVNPTQFNDKNDLRNYPRTPEADCALLEAAGADVVFMPSVEEMYPVPDLRQYDFGRIDKVMEGATRPGHFNGVAQVVSKLFAMVQPARAYFGEKDFQQIAVVKSMVAQSGFPLEIVRDRARRRRAGPFVAQRPARCRTSRRRARYLPGVEAWRRTCRRDDACRTGGLRHARDGAQRSARSDLFPVGRRSHDAAGGSLGRERTHPGVYRRAGGRRAADRQYPDQIMRRG